MVTLMASFTRMYHKFLAAPTILSIPNVSYNYVKKVQLEFFQPLILLGNLNQLLVVPSIKSCCNQMFQVGK